MFDPQEVVGSYVCPTVGAYCLLATWGIYLAQILAMLELTWWVSLTRPIPEVASTGVPRL